MTDPAGRDLTAACWIGGALVGAGLVADVWLLRTGRAPLTSAAQTRAGLVARALLEGHFVGAWGRADPFRLLGVVACRQR